MEPWREYLRGKTVLITGGTGTFGRSFLARLLALPEIKKIIIFSRDELKQSQMQKEIPASEKRVRFFLGDVRDASRLECAFRDVDVVVHAAALKQVPALEYNPIEAIRTNIIGTQNVIEAALAANVEKVLLISTDKSVQPVNLYGATKLCAEKLLIAANVYRGERHRTRLSVARYGNVWGSRGSLVEVIRQQRPSGVVTLTDERMTRFLISVQHVMDIIFQTLAAMEGGEVFVPKMSSFRIADVMRVLAPECRIALIGIRPGEKIHEVLITEYEAMRARDAGEYYAILPEFGQKLSRFDDLPVFPPGRVYASNNPEYLCAAEKIPRLYEA